MSLTSTIQARIENLLLGAYAPSATFSIPEKRFRLHDKDAGALEKNSDATIDRSFQVDINAINVTTPFNPLDGYVLYNCTALIRVGYLFTHSGDYMTENSTYDSGTGYLDDVVDRANTDMHDIIRTVTWHQNWGSLTPAVFGILEKSLKITQLDTKIIAELEVDVKFQASTTSSYV
jgi:hypothetical protein